MTPGPPPPDISPDVSIVVPVFNEAGAAAPLAREIAAAFAGEVFEIVFGREAGFEIPLNFQVPFIGAVGHRKVSTNR